MEGSDETGAIQKIQPSFSNSSSSSSLPVVNNHVQLGINGQMQNLTVEGINCNNNSYYINNSSSSSMRRPAGMPPSYPHSYIAAPLPHNFGGGAHNLAMGAMHSRSVSQPSCFSFDHLPPLSPSTFRESPSSSNENGIGLPFIGVSGNTEGLPPRRGGHRRSSSDVPIGFDAMSQQPSLSQFTPPAKPAQLMMRRDADWGGSGNGSGFGNVAGGGVGDSMGDDELVDDLFSEFMNFDNIDGLNSSSMEDKDSRASGSRTNDSSENEVESSGVHGATSSNSSEIRERGKRRAPGDIAPTGRHVRSLSMDSFMGNSNFNDELPKLQPSSCFRSAQHSPSNSLDATTNRFCLEFGNGDFNATDLNKIMTNEKLAEMAVSDPKRVKRILANRQSAARSKERKMRYISELEHKVQTLQTEATTLSTQLTFLQRDAAGLSSQNNELRFRLQAMQQQAQLREALNEALTAEVQRLKLENGESKGEASPNRLPQQSMGNNHIPQMQPSQYMHQLQQQQQQQLNNQKKQPQANNQNHQQQMNSQNEQQQQMNNQNQEQQQQQQLNNQNQQSQKSRSAQSHQEAEAPKS